MKRIAIGLGFILFILIPLTACEREAQPKPVGSATNKHIEDSPASTRNDAAGVMTDAMKSPLEKAHGTEDAVQRAAEGRSQQAEQTTQ